MGLELELFEEYCQLKRAMFIRKKVMRYEAITNKIQSTRDNLRIRTLIGERNGVGYNPKQPPEGMLSVEEIKIRGKKFVDNLLERERYLLLNEEEDQAMECENHRLSILKLFDSIGIDLQPREKS